MKIITDPSRIQQIKNSIEEGKMILRSGKSVTGRKMSIPELAVVRRSVFNDSAKIGEGIKLGYTIEDVTPAGYGVN